MSFLFDRNEIEVKSSESRNPKQTFLRLSLGKFVLRLMPREFKKVCFGFFLLFIFFLSFLLFPHTTQANTLTRAPSNLGLVGYWSMNEGTSTITFDSSPSKRNGTMSGFSNPATVSSGWGNGRLSKGLNFDGSDDIIDIDKPIYPTNTSWSFSTWVKATPSTVSVIYGEGQSGVNSRKITFARGSSPTKLRVTIQNSTGTSILAVNSTNDVFDGTWHHIVFSDANGTAALYVDGVLDASNFNYTRTGTFPQDSSNIGCIQEISCNDKFIGQADEIRLYNRALSAADAANLFNTKVATRKTISNQGLVGYWPLDEGSGTQMFDLSGKKNDGTNAEGLWVSGKFGGARNFSSASHVIAINNSPSLNPTSQITLSAWVYPTSWSGNNRIIQKGITDNQYRLTAQSGSLLFELTGISASVTTTLPPTNTWTHVVGTYDGSTIKIYYNGSLQVSSSASGSISTTADNLAIGCKLTSSCAGTDNFNGKIDEVRIYSRALSVDEVTSLYRGGQQNLAKTQTNIVQNGLIGYWPFDGRYMNWATGQVSDVSGNGNNGQVTTMSTSTSVATGKVGQGLKFVGVSNGYVDLGSSSALAPTSALSISAWVKSTSCTPTQWIVNRGDAQSYYFRLQAGGAGCALRFQTTTGASVTIDSATGIFTPGVWQHVVGTWDGSNMRSYVDTVLVAGPTAQTGTLATPVVKAGIGGSPSAANFGWRGLIDEVRIYNRALSVAEITLLYNAGR